MDKILLVICNGLSCFIICTILFQFMNERYKKSYSNRTLYIAAEIAMGITAFYINMLNFAILNLLIWLVLSHCPDKYEIPVSSQYVSHL